MLKKLTTLVFCFLNPPLFFDPAFSMAELIYCKRDLQEVERLEVIGDHRRNRDHSVLHLRARTKRGNVFLLPVIESSYREEVYSLVYLNDQNTKAVGAFNGGEVFYLDLSDRVNFDSKEMFETPKLASSPRVVYLDLDQKTFALSYFKEEQRASSHSRKAGIQIWRFNDEGQLEAGQHFGLDHDFSFEVFVPEHSRYRLDRPSRSVQSDLGMQLLTDQGARVYMGLLRENPGLAFFTEDSQRQIHIRVSKGLGDLVIPSSSSSTTVFAFVDEEKKRQDPKERSFFAIMDTYSLDPAATELQQYFGLALSDKKIAMHLETSEGEEQRVFININSRGNKTEIVIRYFRVYWDEVKNEWRYEELG